MKEDALGEGSPQRKGWWNRGERAASAPDSCLIKRGLGKGRILAERNNWSTYESVALAQILFLLSCDSEYPRQTSCLLVAKEPWPVYRLVAHTSTP